MENLQQIIKQGYTFHGGSFPIGMLIYDGKKYPDALVEVPLATLNRHGLITGATGTGKTKTLQRFLEWLSNNGIPSVMMDIKGDISWVSMPGEVSEKLEKYISNFWENFSWTPEWFPTEFFELSQEGGSPFRATVSEFWPMLLSRVLNLSEVQSASLSVIFRYADDNGLLLSDLEDLKKLLSYLSQYAKDELLSYGKISSATVQVIMRQIIQLETQWASKFFGEKSLDIADLMQVIDGKGQINVFRLMNSLRFPSLFTTAMLQLLMELFYLLPEVGDQQKPKLVLVIDEAHLLFKDIPANLLSEIEMVLKLIRSKGVWIIFCTQNPWDIPDGILAQLWLKIQHALRAFTAKDQESIKKMAKNFPITTYYDISWEITNVGIGEAIITAIWEDGKPTPVAIAKILPPVSRMDVISDLELQSFLSTSPLFAKYSQVINPESANEILTQKIQAIQLQQSEKIRQKAEEEAEKERRKNPTIMDSIVESATKSIGTQVARQIGTKIWGKQMGSVASQIVRGVLGSIFR